MTNIKIRHCYRIRMRNSRIKTTWGVVMLSLSLFVSNWTEMRGSTLLPPGKADKLNLHFLSYHFWSSGSCAVRVIYSTVFLTCSQWLPAMSFISEYLPCSFSKLKIYLILGAMWLTEGENGELLQRCIIIKLSETQIHLEIFQHSCLSKFPMSKSLMGVSFLHFMKDLKGSHLPKGERK